MCKPLCELDWQLFVIILSLFVSLIVSISSIIITYTTSKKSRLVDVITSNRVEWIQKFKNLISKYYSLVSYHYNREIPENTSQFMNNLLEISSQIKLHLNFKGKADNLIFGLLDEINVAYDKLLIIRKYELTGNNQEKFFELLGAFQDQHNDIFGEVYRDILDELKIDPTNRKSMNKKLDAYKADPEIFENILQKFSEAIKADSLKSIKTIKKHLQKTT